MINFFTLESVRPLKVLQNCSSSAKRRLQKQITSEKQLQWFAN